MSGQWVGGGEGWRACASRLFLKTMMVLLRLQCDIKQKVAVLRRMHGRVGKGGWVDGEAGLTDGSAPRAACVEGRDSGGASRTPDTGSQPLRSL